MLKINEAAKELYPENRPTMYTQFVSGLERAAFKAGVEFAQRWISVEEELPEFTTIDYHNAVNVRFKTICGDVRECTATLEKVSQHNFENSPYHNRWFVYPSGGHELKTVTHWRPIELK